MMAVFGHFQGTNSFREVETKGKDKPSLLPFLRELYFMARQLRRYCLSAPDPPFLVLHGDTGAGPCKQPSRCHLA